MLRIASNESITGSPALHGRFLSHERLGEFGLGLGVLRSSVEYAHDVLDQIDKTLIEAGRDRLASLIELANLSAIVGNLIRGGVSKASHGVFEANTPHKFPDLLARSSNAKDIEIKVALETNKPKGHLVKPGPHLTVRYVLGDENGKYVRGTDNRGHVVWIWEIRVGNLEECHFSFSNTKGDSGKTAVINSSGMDALFPVFLDLPKCPYSPIGPVVRSLTKLQETHPSEKGFLRNQA